MRKIKLLIVTILISGTLLAQTTFHDADAEVRTVSSFHGVSVAGNIDLYLTQGNEESVAISATEQKWKNQIIIEVKDGILHIYWRNTGAIRIDWKNNPKKLTAYVSVKNIDYLALSGSGYISVSGKIKTDKLKLSLSGSGDVKGTIDADDLSVGISGSGNVDLSGNSDKTSFSISGSGDIGSYDLVTNYCDVKISGSGGVKATVQKEVSASVSGSGDISIKGDANLKNFNASGSGKFKRVK